MFKGFSQRSGFFGVPRNTFGMNLNEAYGFTGVKHYLNAQDLVNKGMTDLQPVSEWVDPIGNISFTQPTSANQPRLRLSSIDYNNLPIVEFFANTRRMISDSYLSGGKMWTLAVVAKADSGTNLNVILGQMVEVSPYLLLGRNTTPLGVSINSGNILDGTPIYSSLARIIVVSPTTLMVDGVIEASGLLSSPYFNTLGSRQLQTQWNLLGSISEVIIYNQSLTDVELLELSNRINQKYAIY